MKTMMGVIMCNTKEKTLNCVMVKRLKIDNKLHLKKTAR